MSELNAYKGDVTIPVYGTIADAEVYLKKDVDVVIAELKQKLEDAQREVNNYRRHANECEGLAAKGDIDKVSLLEEIKDLKNDKELLDSQLYGFLQLEEECGGGDLRNYIAELKQKLESAKATAYTESADIGMENCKLKRALWLVREWRAWCEGQFWFALYSNKPRDIFHLLCTGRIYRTPEEWMTYWYKVEQLCKKKAEAYK